MSSTYREVREALKTAIFTITPANGYSSTLSIKKFHKNYVAKANERTEPNTYPKIFLTTGEHMTTAANNSRKELKSTYFVTIVVLEDRAFEGSAEEQIEAIAEDFERMIDRQDTLGGKVIQALLRSVSLDSGFAHPEGIGIFELELTWHKQY